MEKRGIIKPGVTPPEETEDGTKKADDRLEDHAARRVANAAFEAFAKRKSAAEPAQHQPLGEDE